MSTDYAPPSQPLRLIYDGHYDYQGLWRARAHCWLRVYAPQSAGDVPVVIEVQMPDNPGTSVANFAEKLSWKIAHDPVVWASAPGAARKGCIWIQHYPNEHALKTKKPFRFSVVTFTYEETLLMLAAGEQSTLGEPHWEQVTLELVE